jgi:hypothetical protein
MGWDFFVLCGIAGGTPLPIPNRPAYRQTGKLSLPLKKRDRLPWPPIAIGGTFAPSYHPRQIKPSICHPLFEKKEGSAT